MTPKAIETEKDGADSMQGLVKRRQRLLNQLKKLRTEIKRLPGKYPLPRDGQKIWIVGAAGKRRYKTTFYFVGSPKMKHETIDDAYGCKCFKHQKYHTVQKGEDGKYHCWFFKLNWHAKNGGWEAA